MSLKNEYTIIGIDGGGSRTRGYLFRGGKTLAQSFSGTTRVGTVGVGESCERLLNVIADLCEQANLDSAELDAVVIGLAGVWLEEEKMRSTHLLKTLARSQRMTLNDLLVTSDAELALEGAFEGGNGIMMIVGTGSIALAKSGSKIMRCGGWGIELDDEGSGAWIGREGLTAVVRALDGRGMPTKLTGILQEFNPMINLDQPRTIVKAYAERSFEYHMLTPAVMKCAEEGDSVCMDIIKRAALHLVEHVDVMINYFKVKSIPLALMGGIIEADTLLARILKQELANNKKVEVINPKGTALDGAYNIGIRLIEEMD